MKYLFDTNVLIKNPSLLREHRDGCVMSRTVFDELDYRKRIPEHQEAAQLAIKHINEYRILILGQMQTLGNQKNDARIIAEAKKAAGRYPLTVVSEDEGFQVLARAEGVQCLTLLEFHNQVMAKSALATDDDRELFELVKRQRFSDAATYSKNSQTNPNFIGTDGLTPLIYFVRERRFDEMAFWASLPMCDLDRYDQGKFPMPPYVHAAQRGWLNGVRYLLEKGANPHLLSQGKNKGNSALLIAVWDGRFDIVRFLLETADLQISVNQADGNGFTPLIKAAIKGQREIARYLLARKGIDLLIRDRDRKSAIDHAREQNYAEIADWIRDCLYK